MSKKEELREDLKNDDVLQRILDREHDHRVMIDALRHIWTVSKGDVQDKSLGFVDEDPFIDEALNNYLSFCHNSIEMLRKDSRNAVAIAANETVERYKQKEQIEYLESRVSKMDALKRKIYWLRQRLKKYEDVDVTNKEEKEFDSQS